MNFSDKVIWVTGASSGIGEALAYAFSRQGAKLVLSARRGDELERVRKLCDNPERHLIVPLDLEFPDDFPAKVAEVERTVGPIDILINNAGIGQRAYAKDTALDVDRRVMAINYIGTVALTKAVLPAMLARKSGQIVAVTSLVGHIGTPKRSSYAASKHALHGFFDSLRAEVYDDNVKITIVCPGFIHTNFSVAALVGDGSAQNKMDDVQANGYPATLCAEDILKGLAKGKDEFYVGRKEVYAVYLKRWFPSLFNRLIRKAKVT